jgi:hypothetical protein
MGVRQDVTWQLPDPNMSTLCHGCGTAPMAYSQDILGYSVPFKSMHCYGCIQGVD